MACIAHGHAEFLTKDCCIPIDYELSHSKPRSTFNPYNGGLWFYPDTDSMSTAMWQVYNKTISGKEIAQLGGRARARVSSFFSAQRFANRVVELLQNVGAYEPREGIAEETKKPKKAAPSASLAIVGPGDAACGVGQYGRQLAQALGARYVFYGAQDPADRIILQWHPFYCTRPGIDQWLHSLIEGREIVFDIHDPLGLADFQTAKQEAIYHCHAFKPELAFRRIAYAPLLPPDMPEGGKPLCASSATYKIGWHGLWAPHKGIHLLIEAVKILHKSVIDAGLVAIGAFHDISEGTRLGSLAYWNRCVEMAQGMDGIVGMSYNLASYADIRATLEACDILALPYSCFEKGQSSAAAACIALGKPLIVTPAPLFDDLRDYVFTTAGYEAEDLAVTLGDALFAAQSFREMRGTSQPFSHEEAEVTRTVFGADNVLKVYRELIDAPSKP